MRGLEILVTNSDLVLKQEQRLVKLFVMFKDLKYGTKYVIFTDNSSNELLYGNPSVNGKKMVIMKFKNIKDAELVKEFVWDLVNDKPVSNFEIIEIPELDKLEIIDNNSLEVKDEFIEKLNDLYFKKEELLDVEVSVENNNIKTKQKKNKIPLLLTIIFVLILGGGVIYLKNNPELLYGKDIYVECKYKTSIKELNSNVNELVILTFNNSRILKKHEKEIIYIFNDNDKYYEFKEKNLQYEYVLESGEEKFVDEELSYKLFVDYNLGKDYKFPKGYDELFEYYKDLNYSCSIVEK